MWYYIIWYDIWCVITLWYDMICYHTSGKFNCWSHCHATQFRGVIEEQVFSLAWKSYLHSQGKLYIFSQPPLISFKRDKNVGNFLVRSSFQTNDQPGSYKCARAQCKTCPFIHNANKISGPKQSIKITDHFRCASANVIYCITCTYCKKLYIGETGRRQGDRFRENLRRRK